MCNRVQVRKEVGGDEESMRRERLMEKKRHGFAPWRKGEEREMGVG